MLMPSMALAVWVRLTALGPGYAEFQINQSTLRRLLPGEVSPEGVRLVSLRNGTVDVIANNLPYRLSLGQRIEPMAILSANSSGHFGATIRVNGKSVPALVDTGATWIAFSRTQAEQLGIPYQGGRKITVSTASGPAVAYLVTLDSVELGPILLRNIEAAVSALPDSPAITLLGMSFLQHLELSKGDNSLKLKQLR